MNTTLVVEKLREILLNLHVPPFPNYSTTTALPPSAVTTATTSSTATAINRPILSPVIGTRNEPELIFGRNSFYADSTRESSSFVYGTEVNGRELFGGSKNNNESEANSLLKHLQELIQVLKMSASSSASGGVNSVGSGDESRPSGASEMEFNLTLEDITDLNNLMGDYASHTVPLKHIFIIVLYLLIAFVSIVGNLLVVQLVIRSRRLHTLTHALLANLAVADLFMSTLNIPFSAARVILAEWPFGSFLCKTVPFVQVTSVYVTSITMAVIALDRYQVIMNPLGRRMKRSQGILLAIAIWSLSGLFSLPYAWHHKVVTVLTVRVVNRCQAEFPSMDRRRWLTVATVFGQYFIPLGFTTASYVSIMIRLGLRGSAMGSTTPRQVAAQSKAKRKTIKMLVLTVIFFAVCWAPINAYHLLTHFGFVGHNSTAILICHLIAMSSTCYNPFIYCWLNEHFRREALKWLCCCIRKQYNHPSLALLPALDTNNGTLKRCSDRRDGGSNSCNHSGASIPLFNLRPGSRSSINQDQQQQQQQLHSLTRIHSKGSHRGIIVDFTSSSTSSFAPSSRKSRKKNHNVKGQQVKESRRSRSWERTARRMNSGNVVSSDECEDSCSHQHLNRANNSDVSYGLQDNSFSSLENCHDSGCGTTKAESPV